MVITLKRDWRRKFRFIKVKNNYLVFEYDGKRYMIVQDKHCFIFKELIKNDKGHYVDTSWCTIFNSEWCKLKRLKPSLPVKSRRTLVYSQLDKDYFCLQMTALGFMNGYFEEEVNRLTQKNIEIQQKIDSLNILIEDLRSEIHEF